MTDQEIINAIDAEITNTWKKVFGLLALNFDIAAEMEDGCNSYINGLRFARALIVKRMEGGE